MFENIIKTCNDFDTAVKHRFNISDDEMMSLQYLNIDLAKSIIQDLDENNANHIARIILGYTE